MNDVKLNKYWENRVSKYGLSGTGDISLHPSVNEMVKKLKMNDIKSMLEFSGKTVLDVGCGVGLYSRLAKENGASEIIAIDFAPSSVKMAKSEEIEGAIASVENLPFKDEYFEVVMCISVLYHLVNDKSWENAISELIRVLKPGGTILLQIENREDFSNSKTYRGRPLYLYMDKFKENDLELVNTEDVYAPPKNKHLRLLIRYIPTLGKIMVKKRKEDIFLLLKKNS